MSAGDFYIRRNNSSTTSITTANYDSLWDTEVEGVGSIVTYNAGTGAFQVNIGIYLVTYCEYWYTADTTNNDRIEVNGEIIVGGSSIMPGRGTDYIRKNSGQQECIVSGTAIIEVTGNNTDIIIRFFRGDSSVAGTVDRVPDWGSVGIYELDNSNNFGLYSTSSSETITTTEASLGINTNDRQDTGFSRTSTTVTITNAGRYLFIWGGDIVSAGTGRAEAAMFLERGITPITGCRAFSFIRGSDGCQDGAINGAALVDVGASDTFDVRKHAVLISTTMTLAAGAYLQIWQLPSGNKTTIMEATTGDINASGNFAWDTLPHIDTSNFTATAGNANIDVDATAHIFALATWGKTAVDSPQRAYPMMRFAVASTENNRIAGGGYHRNNSSQGQFMCVNAAGLLLSIGTNQSVTVTSTPKGISGTVDCDSGQFALIDWDSLGYTTYVHPPIIINCEDEILDIGEEGVLLDGENFGSTQGLGDLELGSSPDYATATLESQTINGWNDAQIDFNVEIGVLNEGYLYLFVTENGGVVSAGYQVVVGALPYNQTIEALGADHLWMLDNDYLDTGDGSPTSPMNYLQVGSPTFVTTPICRTNAYSLKLDGNDSSSPANSAYMNSETQTRRVMGGWFMIDNIQQELACIYEEGAQINNYCIILGIGNSVLFQGVDDGGFNIQVYGDVNLAIGRPYHLAFEFSGNAYQNIFRAYIDGVEQARDFGNPPGLPTFPSHTGNIEFGGTGTTLEVGGTDIVFAYILNGYYAAWATWKDGVVPSGTEIEEELFADGARPTVSFNEATQALMQTALEVYDDTTRPNWPLAYAVNSVAGNSIELTATNQVFDPLITMHVRWFGIGTLTWRNSGTSNLVASKCSTPNGGTVTVIETASIKVTVKDIGTGVAIENTRVFIEADTGGPLPADESVTITRVTTVATVSHTAHGLITGNYVVIRNAKQNEYNGHYEITVTDANSYTYIVAGSPATPATGVITSTARIMNELTTAQGEAEAEIDFTSDQPIRGRIRKASSVPKYKSTLLTDTVSAVGYDGVIFLIPDSVA